MRPHAESAAPALLRPAGFALLVALLLTACAVPQRSHPTPLASRDAAAEPRAAPPPASPAPSVVPPGIQTLLTYADKLRELPPPELQAEAEQLRQRSGPLAQLQLALVHVHKQPAETTRALELATQAQADTSSEGLQLQSLARLLTTRLSEQKRLEEQVDKQGKQLAEVQRRLDQSLERLEALKAIERSLGGRPARASERSTP